MERDFATDYDPATGQAVSCGPEIKYAFVGD
jgi:hypothetical protein